MINKKHLVLLASAGAISLAGVATAQADTLEDTRERGAVQCGVSDGLPGFSAPDDNGNWQGDFTRAADHVETQASMASLLEMVDEVHTMTSLTGFEALLRGKRVTCYGLPFYAGWGLTNDKLICARRTRSHSVESLAYFALIEYPTYVDPITRKTMTAEQAVTRVAQMKAGKVQVKDTKLQLLLAMKKAKNTLKRFIRS